MNNYRSYFDNIQAPSSLHRKLLSGMPAEKPARRPNSLLRWGSLAACFALLCVGGWGLLRGTGGGSTGGDTLAIPPTVVTPTPPPTPTPVQTKPAPLLVFDDRTNKSEFAMSIALPDGYFYEMLDTEACRAVLGTDLAWLEEEYHLAGLVTYDGEGKVWQTELWYTVAGDETRVTITLAPDRLPPECVVYEDSVVSSVYGVDVAAESFHYDTDGDGRSEHTSRTQFMVGDAGVRVQAVDETDTRFLAETITLALLREGKITFADATEIPLWRSEKLTLNEARGEESFGKYIPAWVPAGFAFESAHRELGQERDWLSVGWSSGYSDIYVTVYRAEFYPQADNQDAPIPAAELTEERLASLLDYVDNDAGDAAGYRGHFAVDYGDGFLVSYNLKGVSPAEAARLVP